METFQTIWKPSRQFGKLPESLETIWHSILSRQYRKFPDQIETFPTIQKCSRQSGNFPDNPETF